MSQSQHERGAPALTRRAAPAAAESGADGGTRTEGGKGFGPRRPMAHPGGKGRKRRGSGLSAEDRQPLGRSPDLEAMQARRRLGLPLAGRLSAAAVTRAWKRAAAEHHPDRGGEHGTMQAINGARDALLGRGVVAAA